MNTTLRTTTLLAMPVICIGLDVSKDTLDACLLSGKRHEKQFANSARGQRQLLDWAQALARESLCHF